MDTEKLAPVHPGEILQFEFLEPLGISQNKLARTMRVPPGRINAIVNGKRNITAETAIRLGLALRTTPELWMNLQALYDLRIAMIESKEIAEKEVIPLVETPAEI
ncbi:MAG: HigA family addiction module antitoxin [Anaerolineaceae bacterium]